MKNNTASLFYTVLILYFMIIMPSKNVLGQCVPMQLNHTSGTETVGCVEVTVTSAGGVGTIAGPCGNSPYWIGQGFAGSYTFSFSSPIPEVWFSFAILNNVPQQHVEELSIEVNGAFYPVTMPGSPTGCGLPAVISPTGTIAADPASGNDGSSWNDVTILGSINTITIENIWLIGTPGGVEASVYICCQACETDAGEISSSPIDLCPGGLATTPPAGQTFLESDDILQYILFSDQADPTGSIIATSNTPEFAFAPATMSIGTTYYIAAIAGNDLGGNVDLDDPCLDFSNAIEVVWHPEPSVAFSANVTDVCADGCYDIQIDFTGIPPFHLQGEVVDADNTVVIIDETFLDNTVNYTLCLPATTPVGEVVMQAIFLADNHCECN